jgi:hypothetical protein
MVPMRFAWFILDYIYEPFVWKTLYLNGQLPMSTTARFQGCKKHIFYLKFHGYDHFKFNRMWENLCVLNIVYSFTMERLNRRKYMQKEVNPIGSTENDALAFARATLLVRVNNQSGTVFLFSRRYFSYTYIAI